MSVWTVVGLQGKGIKKRRLGADRRAANQRERAKSDIGESYFTQKMHFPVGVDADRVRLLLGDRGGMRYDVGHDQSQGGNATGQCPIDEGVSGYSHFGSFASLAGLFQFVKRFLVERTRDFLFTLAVLRS